MMDAQLIACKALSGAEGANHLRSLFEGYVLGQGRASKLEPLRVCRNGLICGGHDSLSLEATTSLYCFQLQTSARHTYLRWHRPKKKGENNVVSPSSCFCSQRAVWHDERISGNPAPFSLIGPLVSSANDATSSARGSCTCLVNPKNPHQWASRSVSRPKDM